MNTFLPIVRTVALLLSLLAFPHKATAAGGTVVTVSGSTVTITVRIDLCCLHDAVERNILQPLVLAEIARAQAMWNEGLANIQARGCYNIKVVFDVRFLSRASRDAPPPWEDGYHRLAVDFDQPGTSDVFDPESGDANNDTNSAYRVQLGGTWYFTSMTPRTWAHEIGHLMGLGDDYYHRNSARRMDAGARPYTPLPGRAGTLMGDGDAIDQNLADRLADLMTQAGLLPPCGWHGTIKKTAKGGGHNHTIDINFEFVVEPDGSIKGRARAQIRTAEGGVPGCTLLWTYSPSEFDIPLSGRRNGEDFEIALDPGTTTATIERKSCGEGVPSGTFPSHINPAVYAQTKYRIPARDGATNTVERNAGALPWGVNMRDTIEIHQARQ